MCSIMIQSKNPLSAITQMTIQRFLIDPALIALMCPYDFFRKTESLSHHIISITPLRVLMKTSISSSVLKT